MLLLIAAVIFAAVALGVFAFFRPRQSIFGPRFLAGSPSTRESPRDRVLEGNVFQRLVGPLVGKVGNLLARLLPQNAVRRLERMLVMAGEPVSLPVYLTFWVGLFLLGSLVLVYLVLSRPDIAPLQILGVGLPVLGLAAGAPYLILARRVRNRQRNIIRALPDALDLLVTCLEAGLGIDAAFGKVTEKTGGLLSQTFSMYLRQVGMGRTRRDALAYVAHRTGVPDLVRLSSAVAQAESVGASLGDVLRTQAEDLRLGRRQRAQQAAQRAPVLMTIPLVLCFLPAMGIVVVTPSVLNLLRFIGGLDGG